MSDEMAVLNAEGNEVSRIPKPWFMKIEPDPVVVKRVYTLMSSGWHTPQGRNLMAGKRTVAISWGVDHGMSRVPRLSTGRARFAPGTVKGRLAHPPLSSKVIVKKVNRKEKLLATAYAIAATANRDIVIGRGHRLPEGRVLPIIFDESVRSIDKAKDFQGFLEKLGLTEEMKRLKKGLKRRSGLPAKRGRGKKRRVGPLVVVSDGGGLVKAAGNFSGVDVVRPDEVSLRELAPNGTLGRLTLWSSDSVDAIEKRLSSVGEKIQASIS